MEDLTDRVAVVTGAASGIGLAICEAFVREGMRVVMADVNEEGVRTHADRLNQVGDQVHAVAADVRDPEAVEAVGRAVMDRFGKLHVAVNNAGVVSRGLSWELPLEDWHRVIDVDLWGVIHGVRTFVPLILSTREEGHVVNVASMAAVLALDRLGPYTVAKHGVLGLTDVLRGGPREGSRSGWCECGHARHDQDRHEPDGNGRGLSRSHQRGRRDPPEPQICVHR